MVLATVAGAVGIVAASPAANASVVGFETLVQDKDGQLRALTATGGNIGTGAFMTAGTSPALVDLGAGTLAMAFVGPDQELWRGSDERTWFRAGANLHVAAGTSPAVASNNSGHWKIAFHGGNGDLWTIDWSKTIVDTGAVMATGSSPSIAYLPGSGNYEIAFAGSDNLLWRAFPDRNFFHVGGGLGVAPGTSPSIATNTTGSDWKIAFHAIGDHLWTVDAASTAIDTGAVMATGSNPSIGYLPAAGGYETVFAGADSLLWRAFPDTNFFHVGAGFGVAPGTSPSIATTADGWKVAFHAIGDHLWTDDAANNAIDTGILLAPGTSPSIAVRTSAPATVPPTTTTTTTSSPTQVKTYKVQNCDSHAPTAGASLGAGKTIWVRDQTAGSAFQQLDTLQGLVVGHQCGPADPPDSFTFTPATGHIYELRVVDYQLSGCTNAPTSCLAAAPATFQGNPGGQNPVLTVTA